MRVVSALEVLDDVGVELKGDCTKRTLRGYREAALHGEAYPTIRGRVVEIGDCASNQVSADVGEVWLPPAVIALAPHGGKGDVPKSFLHRPMPEAEIARVLVQQAGQDGVAPEIAVYVVRVGGAKALGEAFKALVVLRVGVVRLLNAGIQASNCKGKRVNGGVKPQVKFLGRLKRGRASTFYRVERRHDAE